MGKIRAYADNVVLEWEPEPAVSASGLLVLPDTRKPEKTRLARVIASGPGYYRNDGHGPFIPNEVKPGDLVIVDRQAGQNYDLDIYKPRTHPEECVYGEGRIVRHDEIHAVVEDAEASSDTEPPLCAPPPAVHRFDCPLCDWHAGACAGYEAAFAQMILRHTREHQAQPQ